MNVAVVGVPLVGRGLAVVELLAGRIAEYHGDGIVVVHRLAVHLLWFHRILIHRYHVGVGAVGWILRPPCGHIVVGFIPCLVISDDRISHEALTVFIPGPIAGAGLVALVHVGQFAHKGNIIACIALLKAVECIESGYKSGRSGFDGILGTTEIVAILHAPVVASRCGVGGRRKVVLHIPYKLSIVIATAVSFPEVGKRRGKTSAGNHGIGIFCCLGEIIFLAEIPGCGKISLSQQSLGGLHACAAASLGGGRDIEMVAGDDSFQLRDDVVVHFLSTALGIAAVGSSDEIFDDGHATVVVDKDIVKVAGQHACLIHSFVFQRFIHIVLSCILSHGIGSPYALIAMEVEVAVGGVLGVESLVELVGILYFITGRCVHISAGIEPSGIAVGGIDEPHLGVGIVDQCLETGLIGKLLFVGDIRFVLWCQEVAASCHRGESHNDCHIGYFLHDDVIFIVLEFQIDTKLIGDRRRSSVLQVGTGPLGVEALVVGEDEGVEHREVES